MVEQTSALNDCSGENRQVAIGSTDNECDLNAFTMMQTNSIAPEAVTIPQEAGASVVGNTASYRGLNKNFDTTRIGSEWNGLPWDDFSFSLNPSSVHPELYRNFDDNFNLMEFGDLPINHSVFQDMGIECGEELSPSTRVDTEETNSVSNSKSRIIFRHEAFKRSMWICDPDPHDCAFSEESPQLSQSEEWILKSTKCAEKARRFAKNDLIRCDDARDAILLLVQQHSGPSIKIRSFPSGKMLSFLLRAFFVLEKESHCPFVHMPSFDPRKCRTELLSVMIAASATALNGPLLKMGLALQERVRMAIYRAMDYDMSLPRTLDFLQISILWIEIGLWSGDKRKMEVAESAANNVSTVRLLQAKMK